MGHENPPEIPVDTAPVTISVATSLQERRPRTLKHGDTFAVFDHNGDASDAMGSPEDSTTVTRGIFRGWS